MGDQRLLDAETVQDWIRQGAVGRTHHVAPNVDRLSLEARPTKPLIHRLATALHSEVPDIDFGYFALHDQCWDLMGRIKDEIDKMGSAAWTHKYKVDRENLPFVFGIAFSLAASRLDPQKHIPPSNDLLQLNADIVGACLLEERMRKDAARAEEDGDAADVDVTEERSLADVLASLSTGANSSPADFASLLDSRGS